jgi:hypothetical protein
MECYLGIPIQRESELLSLTNMLPRIILILVGILGIFFQISLVSSQVLKGQILSFSEIMKMLTLPMEVSVQKTAIFALM